MTIRIAVIGTGAMGADHARLLAEDLPGARLQVVCDIDPARARAAADRFGAADAATDADAAIARADVDAVIVASPDATHAPLALAGIRAGKPVLCEKPLSQDLGECRAVIAAEEAAGRRFVQVGFMRRYDQSCREMKAALDDGTLGRPLLMHNVHRNVETPAADFTGAMAITNSAPHEFDVARWVLGCDVAGITAIQARRPGSLVAPVVMVLETTGGQVVTIEVNNNAAYGYDVRGELVGERGAISLQAPVHSRLDAGLTSRTAHAADWRPRYGEAYRRQDRDFLRFARTGRFPEDAADAWDGLAAVAVAQAGVRSLAEGRRVAVEMPARPALYDPETRAGAGVAA